MRFTVHDRSRPKSNARRYVAIGLRLLVTIVLCSWVFYKVDWNEFWSQLIRINLIVVIAVVVLRFLSAWLSAIKWQQLLAVHELSYPLLRLTRWYFVSLFLTQFLPSIIGGDAYRIYKTYHNPRGPACAVLAVFVERGSGIVALLLLGLAGAVVSYVQEDSALSGLVVVIGAVALLMSMAAIYGVLHFNLLDRLTASSWCPKPVVSLIQHAGDYRVHPRRIAIVVAISFVFHVNRIFVIWLLLYAIGHSVHFGELAVAVAAVNVVGMLPISLAGWGLVEFSFIGVMGQYGLSPTAALSGMLMMRVLLLPLVFVGAVAYFLSPRENSVSKSCELEVQPV